MTLGMLLPCKATHTLSDIETVQPVVSGRYSLAFHGNVRVLVAELMAEPERDVNAPQNLRTTGVYVVHLVLPVNLDMGGAQCPLRSNHRLAHYT